MPRRVAAPVLAACVVVLLWVTVPPDIIRFLLRSPIVLSRDLISTILRAFAPAPKPVPTGSPFADIPGSEVGSGIGPASTPTGVPPAVVKPSSTSAPLDASTRAPSPTQGGSPAPGVTSPQDSSEGSEPEDSSPSLETPELPEVDVSPVEEVVEDLENIVEETLPGVSAPEVPEAELPGGLSEVEPPEVEPSELPGVNELPDPGDLPDPTEPLPSVELPELP